MSTWDFQRRSGNPNMAGISLNVAGVTQQAKHPEGTVFVVLDTSGSMAGSKINQVIESLKEIIKKAPPYLRFCVRVFNTEAKLLVTKKKTYLDVKRLVEDVRKTVGSCTALYDAWGVTLKEIPYDASKLDLVHVVIFTDGEDNCSREYNLNSVLDLSKERIKGSRMQLSFIQAGAHSEASRAIDQMDQSNFNVYNVADSADGIKFAFAKVSEAIQLQIQLRVSIGSGTGQITANLNNLALGTSSTLLLQSGSQKTFFQQSQRPALLAGPFGGMPKYILQSPKPVKQDYQFSLKVENISNNVNQQELLAHFQQWGKCKIRTLVSAQMASQMAIISYEGQRERIFAVKNGKAREFRGRFLAVSFV